MSAEPHGPPASRARDFPSYSGILSCFFHGFSSCLSRSMWRAREMRRLVDEGDERDVEAVAEAHEAGGLAACVRIENARKHHRLVGDDAYGASFHAAEAHNDVLREGVLDLEEVAFIDDFQNQFLDVVG